jgi:AcrR family transcriptional regulator
MKASTKPHHITDRGRKTRASLFEAAEKLYGVRGYDGTSIVDLTKAAGIALGTFYIYFPDKKTLFIELVDTLGLRLREHLSLRIVGAKDRLEIERRGFLAFLEFVAKHRHLYRIVRQADFVDQKCFRRYYERMAEPYARGLRAAANRGEIRRGNPEVMAYCLMGVADFIGMRWGLWEKKPSAAVIAEALAFMEGGLVPASGSATRPKRAPAARASVH